MLRRDFVQISTLGVAGLLATRGKATAVPKPIAIIDSELSPSGHRKDARRPEAVWGATTMLRESDLPHEVVSWDADFSPYKVLVLPDNVLFTDYYQEKIETYLQRGGSLLASFRSGLSTDGSRFVLPSLGIELVGKARFSPDFIAVDRSVLGAGMASSELVMYLRGMEVFPMHATVLAPTLAPLPRADSYPAVTQSGQVIYFMHPIFTQYHRTAPRWCRQLVLNALDRLVPGIAIPKTLDVGFEISI